MWRVYAYQAEIAGVPADILPQDTVKNCLPALRAHLADLGDDPVELNDVKLMVLGNGRIGKTQICNRLRDLPFDPDADTTHGIVTCGAPVPKGGGQFNIWDFGGQDIYHGTHALFLKSRAVFMLVWTPDSDNSDTHTHGGMTFRNRPMAWWLDFVHRFGNARSPVVAVQTRLDTPDGHDRGDHPAVRDRRGELAFCRSVAYSARTEEGRAALDGYLAEAVRRFNPPLIGRGRLAVMRRLQNIQSANASDGRTDARRTLPLAAFKAMCREEGGVSDPEQFLGFLHNAGVVFWRRSLFGGKLILDQGWLLDAIYTLFNRDRCYRYLQHRRGRFTPADLALLTWDEQGFSTEEQRLFLGFMKECGICFRYRDADDPRLAEYIAPDLLPPEWDAGDRQERWGTEPADRDVPVRFQALPLVLMRNLISRIGGAAGMRCDYWQTGFYGFEAGTRSKVLVEQQATEEWQGTIRIQTKGGDAEGLLQTMLDLLEREAASLGAEMDAGSRDRDRPKPPRNEDEDETGRKDAPRFDYEPGSGKETWYLSYAWGDDETDAGRRRAKTIDELCAGAKKRGAEVVRDRDVLRFGDRISTFMQRWRAATTGSLSS